MEDKPLTNEESLALITRMISQSKQNLKESSFFFLLWGYVVFVGYLSHYVLFVFTDFPYPYAVWLISIPAVIITIIKSRQLDAKSAARTHIDHLSGQIWVAVFPPLTAFVFLGYQLGYQNITGLILFCTGSAVFLTGKLIKFKPTVYGSIVIWIAAVLAIVYNSEVQYLIGAVAVVFGYLIPGYQLRTKESNV